MPLAATGFTGLDWAILAAYGAVVVALGAAVSRRRPGRDELFLAARGMPMWAVAISVLATSLSAATFLGGPQQAYASDLTYLSANLGGLLAVIVVAVIFVPAFYRAQVTSIYELLGHRFGPPVRTAASAMFMLGRLLASGARLYMVALPFALIAFGDLRPASLLASIAVIAAVATLYTTLGGIRAVIWTDVLQAVVLVTTVAIAFWLVARRIDAPFHEIVSLLREDPGGDKTRWLDPSLDPARPFTIWTALIGFTLFNMAAFGTDQDLTQRLLTCRSARRGAWSLILANVMGWPVIALFLGLGLLLYVFYQHPTLAGVPPEAAEAVTDTRRVFLQFILDEMPGGLRGLMVAGLFAAAMSSTDSALNALASTTIADFYRPLRRGRVMHEVRASRIAIVVWAAGLGGVAAICVLWQQRSGETLIAFALGVMVFAYGGLLGVFLTALLTRRGNTVSALTALAVGLVSVIAMETAVWSRWAPPLGLPQTLAFPWKMAVASVLSFTVCASGRANPPPKTQRTANTPPPTTSTPAPPTPPTPVFTR